MSETDFAKATLREMDKAEVLNENERIFRAWGSVEVKDKQGEIIPIDALKKVMYVVMDRGGVLLDSHTNRPVGKILNYEIREKDGRPGVLLTCKIFNHYSLDDEVWNRIKSGEYTGLSMGGKKKKVIDGGDAKILQDVEAYEFSVVRQPANPEATIEAVNMMAKSADEIKKPFGAWENFDACVSDMKSKGYSDESAKRICGALQARLGHKEAMKEEYPLILELEEDLNKDGRPPKAWWDRCVRSASKVTDTPEQLCGYVFHHVLEGKRERAKGMSDDELAKVLEESKKGNFYSPTVGAETSVVGVEEFKVKPKEGGQQDGGKKMADEKPVEEKKPEAPQPPKKEEEKPKADSALTDSDKLLAVLNKIAEKLDALDEKLSSVSGKDSDEELDVKIGKAIKKQFEQLGIQTVNTQRPAVPEKEIKKSSWEDEDIAYKIAKGQVHVKPGEIERGIRERQRQKIQEFLNTP